MEKSKRLHDEWYELMPKRFNSALVLCNLLSCCFIRCNTNLGTRMH